MFRFSIRELSIAALAVALGIAWCAEHRRLSAALSRCDALKNQAQEATQEAEDAKTAVEDAKRGAEIVRVSCDKNIERIAQQLVDHDLRLCWFCEKGGYPLIFKRSADGQSFRLSGKLPD